MEPKIYALNDITPDLRNWTARVCIVNKTAPRTSSQPTPIKFQKMLLGDEHGNRVEAMLYRSDVDLLRNSFQLDETYLISNALVWPVKQGFENPLVNNSYQWIVSARTAILPSTVAIVFSKHDPRCVSSRGRENTLREYVAIDEAFRPFIITFWNDAVPYDTYSMLDCVKNQHVIAALNFSVTRYHGDISLSSTSSSLVLTQFKNKRFEELQKWQTLHAKEITALSNKDSPSDRPHTGLDSTPHQTMSMHDILAATEPGRFSCTVKGRLSRTNQKFLYLCCDRCHCLTSAEYGCLFECQSCHITKIASPRYRLSLSVFDETGELEVTMFGKEADKLLNLPAENFWLKYQEDTSF
ncbi:hypothetical protein OROHE_000189 [Orobanche hederae]